MFGRIRGVRQVAGRLDFCTACRQPELMTCQRMHRGALEVQSDSLTDTLIVLGLGVATACSPDHVVDPANATPSLAFGIWNPGPKDTCTKEQHDAYTVVGPDGKLYPTWHPPTGPGRCTFGHEHGLDPRGDETGGLPFGVASAIDRRSGQSSQRGPLRSQDGVGE
jgi:hypothetical protein